MYEAENINYLLSNGHEHLIADLKRAYIIIIYYYYIIYY